MEEPIIIHNFDVMDTRAGGIYCTHCLELILSRDIAVGRHTCGATVTLTIGPAVGL